MKNLEKKVTLLILFLIAIFFIFPSIVNAADTYTATSTINGVAVNWSYELNKSNQIENLRCTNPTQVTGNITIPSTLDGKTVVSLGSEAFDSASKLTGVVIPSSIKKVDYKAFQDCTSLTSIDLGSVEEIGFYAFKNCTALESIVIPKSLKTGASSPIFTGCTKLTKITLQDGLTVVPSFLCADTNITSIKIPTSVKTIENNAFSGCTKLTNVDLGNIEELSYSAFKDCTALESIVIPKTLKRGGATPVFTGCTKLTKITLQDGLTIVPAFLCADTNITSIEIPTSVTKIENGAFSDCTKLTKITILDSVTDMGFYLTQPTIDSVFNNHNKDLTIYCYKDSIAAKYAIDTNIKYVYLTKPSTDNPGEDNNKPDDSKPGDNKPDETNPPKVDNDTDSTQKPDDDSTVATGKLPQTGVGTTLISVITLVSVVGGIAYYKYLKLKEI